MREILFRGKAINRNRGYHRTKYKNGEWVYGLLTKLYDEQFENLPAEMRNTDGVSGIEIDYETIGQYTGLTDKNGKKIFEGDIVEFEAHGYCPMIKSGAVIFREGCFGIKYIFYGERFHRIGKIDKWQDMGASGSITYTYRIIGNIHDNPELLKGEQ